MEGAAAAPCASRSQPRTRSGLVVAGPSQAGGQSGQIWTGSTWRRGGVGGRGTGEERRDVAFGVGLAWRPRACPAGGGVRRASRALLVLGRLGRRREARRQLPVVHEPDRPQPWHTQCAGCGGGSNFGAACDQTAPSRHPRCLCSKAGPIKRCNDLMGIEESECVGGRDRSAS